MKRWTVDGIVHDMLRPADRDVDDGRAVALGDLREVGRTDRARHRDHRGGFCRGGHGGMRMRAEDEGRAAGADCTRGHDCGNQACRSQ